MFGKNLRKREKGLLAVCIGLAGIAIGYSMIVEPAIANWRALEGRIEGKATLLAKNTRLLKIYDKLEARYRNYREFISIGKNDEEELAIVLGEIKNIANAASCHIVNIKPRTAKKIGNYKQVLIVVTAEGNIGELARFLYNTETSKELLRIRHFAITPQSSSAKKLKATFIVSKIIFG